MVQAWKYDEVKTLQEQINSTKVVALIDMSGIPAAQLQGMRGKLRKDLTIRVSKQNLMKRALDGCTENKENINTLNDHFRGITGFLFTNMNPFKLYQVLERSKVSAPAKAGAIAPNDIVIPAGDTGLPPGPVIGELGQFGIKAKVDGGSIAVLQDKKVVSEGEEISAGLVSLLNKLKIEPMEIGLNILAVYEGGLIFDKKQLYIDPLEYENNFMSASVQAMNLALNAGIFTSETSELLIGKAAREALSLATEAMYLTEDTAESVLSAAYRKAFALAMEIKNVNPDAVGDDLKNVEAAPAASATPSGDAENEKKDDGTSKEAEEESNADDAAAGLGALFG